MSKLLRTLLGWLLSGWAMTACVTEYQPETVSIPPALIVEGQLTDQPGPHTVSLSYTTDYTRSAFNRRVSGAQVTIVDEKGSEQPLQEVSPGVYRTPAAYRGQAGTAYTLRIVTQDGKRYQSQAERMKTVSAIDSVYSEYTEVPIPGTRTVDKGFNLYVDAKDPATPDDFYRWQWTHYERISVCDIRTRPQDNPAVPYSYPCCTECWNINGCSGNECLNVTSDVNINGNAISRQFILRIPYVTTARYFVTIEQQSLTRTAYQYLDRVKKLTTATGGLFDAAPASVRGNIRNLSDSDEAVFGYFGVSASSVRAINFDRSQVAAFPALQPPLPPQPPFPPGPIPSCVACLESAGRTAIKPRFWQD